MMIYRGCHEPTIDFDYAALDAEGFPDLDEQFWAGETEVLSCLLRWMTDANSLVGVGSRIVSLVLFLKPDLIGRNIAAQVACLPDVPTAADLNKMLIEIERRYGTPQDRL
jgi:hypothetical protein